MPIARRKTAEGPPSIPLTRQERWKLKDVMGGNCDGDEQLVCV
jgi:hypothetical protein